MAEEEPEIWSSCKFSDRTQDKEKCGHLSVIERYYTPRYMLGFGPNKDEDHCVLTHSNKVCLVTLAPTHPILRDKKTVIDVNYQVSEKTNMLTNKVEGKSKKGAQDVTVKSPLCVLTCSDDSRYTIHACLKAQVVEVNARLVTLPQLLTEKTQTEGYVAILLCKLKDFWPEMSKLLTKDQYQQEVNTREHTSEKTDS